MGRPYRCKQSLANYRRTILREDEDSVESEVIFTMKDMKDF